MTNSDGKFVEIHHALINRCKNNDRLAFSELYRYFYRAIYTTCYRILKNADVAEDVMQETFITAFEKIETFKGESTFGAWLKRIAVNKSIDALRRNLSIFQPMNDALENSIPEDSDHSAFEKNDQVLEKVEIIKKALGLLPDGYRVVLSLYLFEGYDHEEIAQILGISESTSRSQYTRAKQKLIDSINKKI
jgi:RNA polymerase sigma factor (sigma-70 family)